MLVCLLFENTLTKDINSNISFCKIKLIFKSTTRLAIFLGSKTRYLCLYALALFISSRVVHAMLRITIKLAVILKLELLNTQIFHFSRTSSPNQRNIQPLKTIFCFKSNQFLLTTLKCFYLVTPSSI